MICNLRIKRSKHFGTCCIVLFFVLLNANAQTTPIGFNLVAYEGFDYTSGTSLLNASGVLVGLATGNNPTKIDI